MELRFDKFLKNKKLREIGFRTADSLGDDIFLPTKLSTNINYEVSSVEEYIAVLESLKGKNFKSADGNEKIISILFNDGIYDFGANTFCANQYMSDENVKLEIKSKALNADAVIWKYNNLEHTFDGRFLIRYLTLQPQSNINGNGFNVLLSSPYFSALDIKVDVANCLKTNNNYSVFLINSGYARFKNINIINGVTNSTGVRLVQSCGNAEVIIGSGITGNFKYIAVNTYGYGKITFDSVGYNVITSTYNALIKSPFILENTGAVVIDGFPGAKLTEAEKLLLPVNYIYDGYLIYNIDKKRPERYNKTKTIFEPVTYGWDDISAPLILHPMRNTNGKIQINYEEVGILIKAGAIFNQDYIISSLQFPHGKKLLTAIHPHIHFIQNQNSKPNLIISYRWYNNGENVPATWTRLPQTTLPFPYVSGNMLQIIYGDFITKTLEGEKLSSQIDIRIQRDTTNVSGLFAGADPYVGDVLLKYFDIHIEKDMNGSDEELTKL